MQDAHACSGRCLQDCRASLISNAGQAKLIRDELEELEYGPRATTRAYVSDAIATAMARRRALDGSLKRRACKFGTDDAENGEEIKAGIMVSYLWPQLAADTTVHIITTGHS